MRDLTERQGEVLAFIGNFVVAHAYPPTIREIAESFAISIKGAYDHVKALEKKGHIRLGENRSRTIEVIKPIQAELPQVVSIPILGSVAAGRPIFADENFEGNYPVPASMVGKALCFALAVRGDSMRDAGILDGDIAVVEQRPVAEDGEIVVALIEESATLKRFFRERGRVRLAAENPAYAPIFTQDVRILGRLKGIIRSY